MKPVFAVPLVLLFLLLAAPASALGEDISMSGTFEPGDPLTVRVVGPPTVSLNIRITDVNSNIVAGRDAALNETGVFVYVWTPQQPGSYNVTVTFATGLSITKSVVIVKVITEADLGEIYQALYRTEQALRNLLKTAIDGITTLVYLAIGIAAASVLTNLYLLKRVMAKVDSQASSSLEAVLKAKVESFVPRNQKAEKPGR